MPAGSQLLGRFAVKERLDAHHHEPAREARDRALRDQLLEDVPRERRVDGPRTRPGVERERRHAATGRRAADDPEPAEAAGDERRTERTDKSSVPRSRCACHELNEDRERDHRDEEGEDRRIQRARLGAHAVVHVETDESGEHEEAESGQRPDCERQQRPDRQWRSLEAPARVEEGPRGVE